MSGGLPILLGTARQLAKLCRGAAALVQEARDAGHQDDAVIAAARLMHSDLLRTKHAVEDELVTWVLDCSRCGRRVHWVVGEGCEIRPLGACGAGAEGPQASAASEAWVVVKRGAAIFGPWARSGRNHPRK